MGFTHVIKKDNTVEHRTRDCFLPGMEDMNQTKWLNAKEETYILEQCQELYPVDDVGDQEEHHEGEEEEIVAQLPDEIESDEEDGPPTTSWEPSSKERTALDLLHRSLGHPPAHKLAKVLKLGGVRKEVWQWSLSPVKSAKGIDPQSQGYQQDCHRCGN
eukprot:1111647-Amphidinium_carterae.2